MERHKTAPTLHLDWIDPSARKIVQTLQSSNFEAYLVGGCVRDLLVGIHPKDYDIATNALPNEVKRKIPGSYVIGKRFRLVLVKRGDQQFEVATFRRNIRPEELEDENNPIVGDNYFGTCEQDAQRRDFTINALFYDPIQNKILDFIDGQKDIEARTLRMIGDPKERLIEDPIRSLRALRLSHKLDFTIEPSMRAAMVETAPDLLKSALPRRREEYLKIMRLKDPTRAWAELFDLNILKHILPGLHELYEDAEMAMRFEHLVKRLPVVGIDMSLPVEMFAGFLFAFLKARKPDEPLDPAAIESSPRWSAFMKDEVGMFKVETMIFLKSLELLGSLLRIDAYKKKGHRRQMGFLRNETLPLALKLSQLDGDLDQLGFNFWLQEFSQHGEKIHSMRDEPLI